MTRRPPCSSSTSMSSIRHRAGFVNIIGNPNVGKSTLMNALVGERLSIITSKAQTTRHRIMGIVNGDDYQIVYSDTPGILKPAYSLQESMMEYVDTAIGDADIILYVTDVVEKGDKNRKYVDRLAKVTCPVLIVINKIDNRYSAVYLSCCPKESRGTTRTSSPTAICAFSPRRSSARRYSPTTTRRFRTAPKSPSRNSRKMQTATTSGP